MKLLITGGGGFVGARLARTPARARQLGGSRIERLVLADQVAPPADLAGHARVEARVGAAARAMRRARPRELRRRVPPRLGGQRRVRGRFRPRPALQPRHHARPARRAARRHRARHPAPRLVFSSSVAVFGPDPSVPMPDARRPTTRCRRRRPRYGTHKLMCEHLIADYTRKGYIDGRAARLMTVTVRAGRPNGAASSFFSRHHPRAAGRRGIDLPGRRPTCRIR